LFRRRAARPGLSGDVLGPPLKARRGGDGRRALFDAFRLVSRAAAELRGGARVPFVAQTELADCAAACLAMAALAQGVDLDLAGAKRVLPPGRGGTSARAVLDAARLVGLRGRAVRAELQDLRHVPVGSVLHWDFNHFVVLQSARRDGVVLVDPALGRRQVDWAAVDRSFTGVALVFEPGEGGGAPSGGQPRDLRWSFVRSVLRHRSAWARVVAVSVALQALVLLVPLASAFMIDRVVPFDDADLLRKVVAAGAVVAVGLFLLSAARSLALASLRALVDARLSADVLEHLLALPYPYFQTRSAGDLLLRVRSGAAIRQIVTTGLLSSILDGWVLVLSFAALLRVDPFLAVLVVGAAALQVAVVALAWPTLRDLARAGMEAQSRTQNNLVQALAGIETIKASGGEAEAFERWSAVFVDELNLDLERARVGAVVESLLSALRFAAPFAVLSTAMFRVLDRSLSVGSAVAAGMLAGNTLAPVASLLGSGVALSALAGYSARLADLLGEAREDEDQGGRRLEGYGGAVELAGAGFVYAGSPTPALSGASVLVEPGSFIAVVGPSGAGKSTLAMLAAGLLRPTAGDVLYDGVPRSELDLSSLRRRIGIVTQRAFLFSGTVRENLALWGDGIDDERVEEAARLARIHDDVEAMPLGYETRLSDAAGNISGGQRQRLAIARALVNQPALVVLDEATSAVDGAMEAQIIEDLRRQAFTLMVVTHRLNTVRGADAVVVVEDGRVTACGPYEAVVPRLRGGWGAQG
jgi:ABC-type bacteriocin/lantibiotic exporter with double-glycine peptidase domain